MDSVFSELDDLANIKTNINPEVLQWARKDRGYDTPDEFASELKIDLEVYGLWEQDGRNIPLGQLKTISSKLKRQLATFFLPNAPELKNTPKDFRNLSPGIAKFSRDTLYAFRRARNQQEIALEINGEDYWSSVYSWKSDLNYALLTNENYSALRLLLGVTIQDQIFVPNPREMYKHWRNVFEKKLGILVFQFSMPFEEVQGFSFHSSSPNIIAVNSKHAPAGRIFTLFHELAHIILGNSGVCSSDIAHEQNTIELQCNEFAAKFLVPDEHVVPANSMGQLRLFANKYGVSREVYLRRMQERGMIADVDFYEKLSEIRSEVFKKTKGGITDQVLKSRSNKGNMFFEMVAEGARDGKITYASASDCLELGINYLLNG